MDLLQIILRVIHIGAGIMWVGSALFVVLFVTPTAKELGPQGGPFVAHMNQKRKLPIRIGASAVLTITAGIWLYWRDTNGFDIDLITTSPGIALAIGGLAAIAAFVIGFAVAAPKGKRLGELGQAMASGQPTEAQVQEMGAIQKMLRSVGVVNMVLLLIAVIAMAAARYL